LQQFRPGSVIDERVRCVGVGGFPFIDGPFDMLDSPVVAGAIRGIFCKLIDVLLAPPPQTIDGMKRQAILEKNKLSGRLWIASHVYLRSGPLAPCIGGRAMAHMSPFDDDNVCLSERRPGPKRGGVSISRGRSLAVEFTLHHSADSG
jgi:hypothetical protein